MNDFPAGTFGIAAFACDAKVENTLQRLILFACADCPDPSGRPGIITSYSWLARFCIAPVEQVKAEIDRMIAIGVLVKGMRHSVYATADDVRLLCNPGA